MSDVCMWSAAWRHVHAFTARMFFCCVGAYSQCVCGCICCFLVHQFLLALYLVFSFVNCTLGCVD